MLKQQDDLEFLEQDRACSYFCDKKSDLRYRYINNCTQNDYMKMLERGWRRFGKIYFVPECKDCFECVSMRIDVQKFEFSKNQKKILSKNRKTKILIQAPSISKEHLELYDKYHIFMKEKKSWLYNHTEPNEYYSSYMAGNLSFAKELLFFRDDKLVNVALLDILGKGLSSIYCFYSHEFSKLSLGKFSVLTQIQLAKSLNIPYIYLGYWIKDHLSMGYKDYYEPFEVLLNRPKLDEKAIWQSYKS